MRSFEVKYTHRDPQWQKSEDIEKKFVGSSMYFANKRPYVASVSGGQAPTMMGTIFTEVLQVRKVKHQRSAVFPHMNLQTVFKIKTWIKKRNLCESPVHIPLENLGEVR